LDDLVDDASLEEDYVMNVDTDGHIQATAASDSGTTTSATKALATPHNLSSPKDRKLHAQFRCQRIHNEQLVVAPCEIILARETFYGMEGVGSVIVYGQVSVLIIC
jgi:hypothetical protein